jgi:hypothetical protein
MFVDEQFDHGVGDTRLVLVDVELVQHGHDVILRCNLD